MINVVKNGQQLSLDASGNLNVNLAAGSISGGNLAASSTGAAVPAFAGYTGINVAGNLIGLTGFSLAGGTPAAVAIVDGTGAQITSFGGGTQYLQGVVQGSPTGTVAMGKNPSNVINALSLDASGFLQVNVAAGSSGNAAAGLTGAAVPLSGDYTAFNSAGNLVGVSTANPLPVAQQGTVTVTLASTTITGSVAVTQSTSPWVDNITQFGSTNLSTGTGASGAGIPRVTVSNDSNILATQSGTWTVQQGTPPWTQNLTQLNSVALGSPSSYGTSPGAVSVVGVNAFVTNTVATTVGGTVAVTQSTSPWADNITQFGGVNLSTGVGASGTGIPRVTVSNDSNVIVTQSGTWLDSGSDGSFSHPLLTDSKGSLVIADTGGQSDILYQLLLETRSMKAAVIAMVTESGKYSPRDFNASLFTDLNTTEMAVS